MWVPEPVSLNVQDGRSVTRVSTSRSQPGLPTRLSCFLQGCIVDVLLIRVLLSESLGPS